MVSMPAEHDRLDMQAINVYHCGGQHLFCNASCGVSTETAWHGMTVQHCWQDMHRCSVWSMVWEPADTGLQLAIINVYLKHNVLALAVVY